MTDTRLLQTDEDVRASHAVMQQLRPHLNEDEYVERVNRMAAQHGYLLAGLFEGERPVSLAGFRLSLCLHYGAFVYVDDLVSDETLRSKGHGAQLLKWVAEYGEQRGYPVVRLDSGVQRADAHRFYFREGYHIANFHFLKG